MKIIAFNGSPRGDKSVTNMMVEEFLSGARKAGAQTENILLSTKKIHHCVGCFLMLDQDTWHMRYKR